MNPGHQPERFQAFTMIPGTQKFTIKDCDFVFEVDRYGGWFDQHGNYYNQHAQPDQPPSDSELSSQEEEEGSYDSGEESDEFQKQFGRPQNLLYDRVDQEQDLQSIASNLSILETYPKESMVRVFFDNVGVHTRKEDLLKSYSEQVKGILNIILEKKGNKNVGSGHFIVADPQSASALINLEGKCIFERRLFFDIQKYQNFLIEPIQIEELKKEDKPKYIAKGKKQQKAEEVLQSIPWCYYIFEKKMFPSKAIFKQWMIENGFIFGEDFKNIEKIQNDSQKKFAKIEMKVSTFKSVNGLQYEGKKVEFKPQNE